MERHNENRILGTENITPRLRRLVTLHRDGQETDCSVLIGTLQDAHMAGNTALKQALPGTTYKPYIDVQTTAGTEIDGYAIMQAAQEIASAVISYSNRKGNTVSDNGLLMKLVVFSHSAWETDPDVNNLRAAACEGILEARAQGQDLPSIYRAGYRYVCNIFYEKGVLGRKKNYLENSIDAMQEYGRDLIMLPGGAILYVSAIMPLWAPGLESAYASDEYMQDICAAASWVWKELSGAEQEAAMWKMQGLKPSQVARLLAKDENEYKKKLNTCNVGYKRLTQKGKRLLEKEEAKSFECLKTETI